MKKQAAKFTLFLLLMVTIHNLQVSAQCPAGSATATTNWDNLDYLVTTGGYAGYVTSAMASTQGFAIGRTGFTIAYPATITSAGENDINTAEAGSLGSGSDISYNGNGTVTITFDTVVRNLQFSLYDIDALQIASVKAWDAGGLPLNVVMSLVTTGINTLAGSNTILASATALVTNAANNDTKGTLNISFAGNTPVGTNGVKKINIILSGIAGDWWLSDLTACVFGSFPVNYFLPLQPFTGTPTYVIGTSDTNTVSLINVATGQAKMIFQDAASTQYINGLGFDHINRDVYYVWDHYPNNDPTNKTLRKFNFASQKISTVIADVTTIGIAVYSRGVESAGCAFYDGKLYFGIEGFKSGNGGGRENTIWRITFNAYGTPVNARQAYSTPSDDGLGTLLHDWADFAVTEGMIYDFNCATAAGGIPKYTHYNMQTGQVTNVYVSGTPVPRQTGITWNNTLYNLWDSISVYNGAGGLGPRIKISGTNVLDWVGNCGDATGFRPKYDLGDAPATYDPVALSPALHDKDTTLRIGATWDDEFDKQSSVPANGDGADEDGIATVPIFSPGAGNYLAQVSVYNHTGTDATLCAWLDFNGNGLFDAAEGITQIITSSTSLQNKFLFWQSAPTGLSNGSVTYLRIRLTTVANGMTVSNATGYYSNGEIEDYRIVVDNYPLGVNLITFDAKPINNKNVKLTWIANEETGFAGYEIQRSTDSHTWQKIAEMNGKSLSGTYNYQINDESPLNGLSYYRLKLKENSGSYRFSEVKIISIDNLSSSVTIVPNPAKYFTTIKINAVSNSDATIRVMNSIGGLIHSRTLKLMSGSNKYELPIEKSWPVGTYFVQIIVADQVTNKKLVINR